jgi:hypothetical protein
LFIVPDSLEVDSMSQNKIKLEKDQLTIQELAKLKMRLLKKLLILFAEKEVLI